MTRLDFYRVFLTTCKAFFLFEINKTEESGSKYGMVTGHLTYVSFGKKILYICSTYVQNNPWKYTYIKLKNSQLSNLVSHTENY